MSSWTHVQAEILGAAAASRHARARHGRIWNFVPCPEEALPIPPSCKNTSAQISCSTASQEERIPVKPDWIIPREMSALVAVIPIKIPAESDGIRNVVVRVPFSEWWCLKQSALLLCIKESESAVQSKLINCFSLSVWAPRGSVCVPRKKYVNYSFCRAFINHVVINTTNAVNWR